MFYPRLITALIAIILLALAAMSFAGVLPVPFVLLQMIAGAVLVFFALTAVVLFVGLTDAERAPNGELIFGTSRRGRMAQLIRRELVATDEAHCCDMYVGTSKLLMMVIGATCVLAMMVSGVGMLAFSAVQNPEEVLVFIIFAVGMLAIFALIFKGITLYEKYGDRIREYWNAHPAFRRVVRGARITVFAVAAVGLFWVLVFLPIDGLMAVGGLSLMGAIGAYLFFLALLPIPAYCIGGKKLLLGTRWGEKVCPIVR